jgi:predicted GH43/DUF377 family glycosyl hydrolase
MLNNTTEVIQMKKDHALIYIISIISLCFFNISESLAQSDWELFDDPILFPGKYNEWDGHKVYDPAVIYDNGIFHMWYTGYKDWWSIGYAFSEDGFNWIKYQGNPVITSYSFSSGHPCIIKKDNLFSIYYSGNIYGDSKRIYMGISEDGIHWDVNYNIPALDLGLPGQWDDNNIHNAFVIDDGIEYKMYYAGEGNGYYQIGIATSGDGENWERYDFNPILTPGYYNEWDDFSINNPCVYFDGEIYHMWYNGENYSAVSGVGYAISSDGYNWEKYSGNPVLHPNPHIRWCSSWISAGVSSVLCENYYMVCSGSDGNKHFIGMGVSPFEKADILTVSLIPDSEYFHKGNNIGFHYEIKNISEDVQLFDVWMDLYLIELPYKDNPICGPLYIKLQPDQSIGNHIQRKIPESVPVGGPYSLKLKTGNFPNDIWAEDNFEFFILP